MAKERNSRKFDFSKSNENRFDFTKDEPDVVETPQQPNSGSSPDVPTPQPDKKSNTGKIVGGIAAAAAILAGVYFFGIKDHGNTGKNTGAQTEQIAQAGETDQPETAQQAGDTEDATANNDSEAPAPVEAKETPASGDNSNAATPAKAEEKQAEKPSATETPAAKPAQPSQPNSGSTTSAKQSTASALVSGDVVENAKRVIRGDFGNGQERKDKLGSAYAEIQGKVNEMYRQGLVH